MRTKTLIFLLLLNSTSFAQKFSTYIGLGLGGNFEQRFPDCPKKDRGRIAGYIGQYYAINDNFSIGLQAIFSGRFLSSVGGDGGPCSYYIDSSNTNVLSYNNLNASSYLVRGRYLFTTENKCKPYVDLGIGITNYFTGSVTVDQSRVRETSFAISPEIGVQLSRFNFACVMVFGGKTPAFEGFDSFSNMNVSLSSIKSQQLYVMVGYRLFKF